MKILILAVLIFLSGCKLTESPSLALAKEMCSCLYVVKQSKRYCREVNRESRYLSGYKQYDKYKMVIAKGLGHFSRAEYINERMGCRIVDQGRSRDAYKYDNYPFFGI